MFQRTREASANYSTAASRVSRDRHGGSQGSRRAAYWVALPSLALCSIACTAQLNLLEGVDEGPESDARTSADSTYTLAGREMDAGAVDASHVGTSSPDASWATVFEDASMSATYERRDAGSDDGAVTVDGTSRTNTDGGQPPPDSNASASGRDAAVDVCAAGLELCLVAATPSHGSVDVSTTTHVVLAFNRDVYPANGTLSVAIGASGAVFEEMPLSDPRVTIDGQVVTVDLDGVLAGETTYTVSLTEAALTAEGVTFAGLTAGELSFTTTETELPLADDELVLWIDPSFDQSIKTEAGRVVVAGDRSGKNNSLRQSSVGARPSLQGVDWTERDVLRFEGDDVLVASQLTEGSATHEIFVVWRSPVSAPSTLTTIFNHGVREGVQVQLTHGHSVATFRNAAITRFASGTYQALQFSAPPANQTLLWNANFDGARMSVYVDGRQVTGVDVAEAPRTPSEVMALGGGPANEFAFNGFVAELLYFGRSLSPSERSVMSEHLLDKWMP